MTVLNWALETVWELTMVSGREEGSWAEDGHGRAGT